MPSVTTCELFEVVITAMYGETIDDISVTDCNIDICTTDKCNGAGSTGITLLALPLLLAAIY